MIRIILGVIVGFIAWTIIWIGSDQFLINALDWYSRHHMAFTAAVVNHAAFEADQTVLIMNIARSLIASLLAGYLTAVVAGENRRSTIALGVVLLIVGVVFETIAWNYLPIWYHLLFLVLLIPVTIAGGKLKRFSRHSN